MRQEASKDKRVRLYEFDDPVINDVILELTGTIEAEKNKKQRNAKWLKIFVALGTLLLTAIFEYFWIMPIKKDGFIPDLFMVIFPVVSAFLGYAMANFILVYSGEERNLFYKAFQWANENRFFYTYRGKVQEILSEDGYWTYAVVGNYLWRLKNGEWTLNEDDAKEVQILLIDSFSDEMQFEGVFLRDI